MCIYSADGAIKISLRFFFSFCYRKSCSVKSTLRMILLIDVLFYTWMTVIVGESTAEKMRHTLLRINWKRPVLKILLWNSWLSMFVLITVIVYELVISVYHVHLCFVFVLESFMLANYAFQFLYLLYIWFLLQFVTCPKK